MGEVRFFLSDGIHKWLLTYADGKDITLKEAVEEIITEWKQQKKRIGQLEKEVLVQKAEVTELKGNMCQFCGQPLDLENPTCTVKHEAKK